MCKKYICPKCESKIFEGTFEYVGIVFWDNLTGFCQEGYICNQCGYKAQKPTMFSPEAKPNLTFYKDCIFEN